MKLRETIASRVHATCKGKLALHAWWELQRQRISRKPSREHFWAANQPRMQTMAATSVARAMATDGMGHADWC